MIDTVRTFAGKYWRPDVVMTALPAGAPRGELENIFGTNVSNGHSVTSIDFAAALLHCGQSRCLPATEDPQTRREPQVPARMDTLATVTSVADLALYGGYPRIDWVAAKLSMSRRSLQRLLGVHGTTFNHIIDEALLRRAKFLLDGGTTPITEIALELGYSDPAHFTRAFRRWTGISPTTYRTPAI